MNGSRLLAVLFCSLGLLHAQAQSGPSALPPPPPLPILYPDAPELKLPAAPAPAHTNPGPNPEPPAAVPTPQAPQLQPQTQPPIPVPAPAVAPELQPVAAAPGPWKILFDGKTVKGLRGVQKSDFLRSGWKIGDGALFLTKEIKQSGKQTGGDLMTTESYDDFEFSFEWKLEISGDSGIIYLTRSGTGQKPSGHEFQIVDDVRNPDGLKGGPIKRTGALYGVLEANENKHIRDGDLSHRDWNEGSIKVQGNHVEHWINNEMVLEYELNSPALKSAASKHHAHVSSSFGTKFKTPIVILDEGEEVAYRNLKIRQLPPKP